MLSASVFSLVQCVSLSFKDGPGLFPHTVRESISQKVFFLPKIQAWSRWKSFSFRSFSLKYNLMSGGDFRTAEENKSILFGF